MKRGAAPRARYSTMLRGTFSSGPTRPPSPLMAWHWRQERRKSAKPRCGRGSGRGARRHRVREAVLDAHHGDLGELVRPRVAHRVALAGALPDHVERGGIGLAVVDRDRSRPRAGRRRRTRHSRRLEQHAAVARARVAVERAQQRLRPRSPRSRTEAPLEHAAQRPGPEALRALVVRRPPPRPLAPRSSASAPARRAARGAVPQEAQPRLPPELA